MKIQIWIPIEDAVKNRLNPKNYSVSDPDNCHWVCVLITPDEFAQLEDFEVEISPEQSGMEVVDVGETHKRSDKWYIEQYNRNRHHSEQINNINQIK